LGPANKPAAVAFKMAVKYELLLPSSSYSNLRPVSLCAISNILEKNNLSKYLAQLFSLFD